MHSCESLCLDGDDNSSGTVTNADGSQIVVGGDSAGSKAVIDYITQNQLPVEIHFLGIGPSVSASTTANFKAVADATGGSELLTITRIYVPLSFFASQMRNVFQFFITQQAGIMLLIHQLWLK